MITKPPVGQGRPGTRRLAGLFMSEVGAAVVARGVTGPEAADGKGTGPACRSGSVSQNIHIKRGP